MVSDFLPSIVIYFIGLIDSIEVGGLPLFYPGSVRFRQSFSPSGRRNRLRDRLQAVLSLRVSIAV